MQISQKHLNTPSRIGEIQAVGGRKYHVQDFLYSPKKNLVHGFLP